jgi:hypothetical protein
MYWTENRIARASFLRAMICDKKGDTEAAEQLRKEAKKLRTALMGVDSTDGETLEQYERMVFYH